jgi:Carboxypeptidase regulatory-like domain
VKKEEDKSFLRWSIRAEPGTPALNLFGQNDPNSTNIFERTIQMRNLASVLTHTLHKGNVPVLAAVAAVGLVMFCSNALAQSGAGSIQGTVTDATGAVIPDASIHVVNQATGVAVDTKSNNVGFYQVPSLFTGSYVVTITVPGMKTYAQTIELLVDQNAVINAAMTAGAVTQQVQVKADVAQLTTTDNGEVGTALENARINQLPMNGRDIETLVNEATPGLDACSQAPSCANGLLPGGTIFEIDGVTLQSDEFGGTNAGENALPDPDAIQEVRMETSGEGAQYATPATGVMTTKSGTNKLHGSLFETARNNGWGIAKSRQDPANYAAPEYIRNEFGASVGGPIVIPHLYHGKDKSFFFFAYERYSLAQLGYEQGDVPTTAMRNGDWSGLSNSSGVLQTLYDPNTTQSAASNWSRQTFTSEFSEGPGSGPSNCNGDTNCIPISRISPLAKILYAISPPPTNTANPLVTDNINIPSPGYTVAPNMTFRLDHVFNENNRAYLRYTSNIETNTGLRNNQGNEPITIAATVNGSSYPAALSGEASSPSALFATAAGYTHVFSPTFFAETILSQQWLNESNKAGGPSPHTDVAAELGLPNNFGLDGFPDITASIRDVEGTEYQYWITGIISTLDENLTKISGKHQMQFGGRYRHERVGYQTNQDLDHVDFGAYATALENPQTNGTGAYTATSNTGYADADQFLGAAEDYTLNLEPPYVHFHDMEFDGYFQDNYHVARNLTLNLGLRYEAHPALWMKNGTIVGFDLKNDAEVLGAPVANLIAEGYTSQSIITNIEDDGGKIETAQQAGLPSALVNNYDFNFLPRFGFAWQALHKWGTVLRGAYGRYIYPVPSYFTVDQISSVAPFAANFEESYINAAQSPDGLPDYLLRSAQTSASTPAPGVPPIAGVNSSGVVNTNSTTAILPGSSDMDPSFIDPTDAPDFVTQANVTIEQPLKGNSALRVSWNFSHDADVWNDYYVNEHPTTYVWEMNSGKAVPNGSVIGSNQYAATATGPYDQTTWSGSMREVQKNGWTTDNMLQANYQRLYHRGVAYQISYIWSKPMHTGGESGSNGYVYPSANYIYSAIATMTPLAADSSVLIPTLPPPQPRGTAPYAYYKALNRFENFEVDTAFPKQEIKFNGIVDMPVGRGKRFLSNANRALDELVGGWQIAGDGNIHAQDFTITSSNWGPTNPLHVYKHGMPITDCRSGVCYKEYEWFNGYLAPTVVSGNTCAAGLTAVVSGLSSGWAPYQSPADTSCSAPVNGKTVTDKYYGDNEVDVTLPGGSPAAVAYSPGSDVNPFSKTVLNGPFNWTADASLFKVFPIRESMNLRFNMDAFNVFNYQGQANPSGADGTTPCTAPGGVGCSSENSPRQIQFTLRLSF